MTFKTYPATDVANAVGVLPIANGGTNSSATLNSSRVAVTSAGSIVEASALTANRVLLTSSSGIPTANGAITASCVLVSDSSGFPTASATTTALLATMPLWTKYSVTYVQLAAAALTNDIELFSLPAKTLIHKVVIKQTTAFTGTTTYTLSVGINGSLTKYLAVYDVTQAVSATGFGVALASVNATLENFSSATSIRVSAIATVQNLDQASAGAADIYVQTSTMP